MSRVVETFILLGVRKRVVHGGFILEEKLAPAVPTPVR